MTKNTSPRASDYHDQDVHLKSVSDNFSQSTLLPSTCCSLLERGNKIEDYYQRPNLYNLAFHFLLLPSQSNILNYSALQGTPEIALGAESPTLTSLPVLISSHRLYSAIIRIVVVGSVFATRVLQCQCRCISSDHPSEEEKEEHSGRNELIRVQLSLSSFYFWPLKKEKETRKTTTS